MPAEAPQGIPIISLQGDETLVAQEVYKACTEHGFMYVTGHGVSEELMRDVFDQTHALFDLPLEAKQALLADENNRGWTPWQEETLDPGAQVVGDTKEGFYFGREIAADSPEAALPLHGPNQWPPPALLPRLRPTYEAYQAALTQLGLTLLRLLALALGLPGDTFLPLFDRPMTFLRPLHYSPQVSAPTEGVFAAGAHTDYGMLTMLTTDGTPGLQIHAGGCWLDVPQVEGAFIINLGDMLERWTNGLFRSTLHRVVNTTGQQRYSIAFFFEPNFDAAVECLPCCCSPERPPRYPPTTAGQHLLDKYAATHAGHKQQRLGQQPRQQDGEQEGGAQGVQQQVE